MFGKKKPRLIDEWHVDSSVNWFVIPVAPPAGWELELAGSLTQDEERQRLIAEHAVEIQTELIQQPGMWLGFAAWVPDLDRPWFVATMAVEIQTFDVIGDRDLLREKYESRIAPGFELHQQTLTDIELPGGPTLRRAEIVSQTSTGWIEERLTYTVLPPGAAEGLVFNFVCAQLQYGERLLEEADVIVNSLTLKTVSR